MCRSARQRGEKRSGVSVGSAVHAVPPRSCKELRLPPLDPEQRKQERAACRDVLPSVTEAAVSV